MKTKPSKKIQITSKLKMVKRVYFADTEELKELIGGDSCTGLVFELEDGTLLRGQSTDVIMPFEKIK